MNKIKECFENLSQKQQKVLIISFFICIITFFFFLLAVLTDGIYIKTYFSPDANDSFMDFFNVFALLVNNDPYAANPNYPPFIFAILRFAYCILPIGYRYPNGGELRVNTYAVIVFIVFLLTNLTIIFITISSMLKDCGKIRYLFLVSLLLSGPLIFTIERGNVILMAVAFALIFYKYYDHPSFKMRLLSYFALAISIAIKIYPAFFGLLVISKKRYKEFALLVLISFLFTFVPFFFFGGIEDIKSMFGGIGQSIDKQTIRGSNYNYSFYNLFLIIEELFNCKIQINNLVAQIIGAVICLPVLFLTKKEFVKTLALTIAIMYFPPFSYTYSLLFFIIPLIAFLNDEQRFSTNPISCSFFACYFIIIFSPLYLPIVIKESTLGYKLSYDCLIRNIFILSSVFVIYYLSIQELINRMKNKTTSHNNEAV